MADTLTITVELPRDLIDSTGRTEIEAAVEAKQALILRWYQQGRISGGKAAELLEVTRNEFIDLLAREGISLFNATPESLEEGIRHLNATTGRLKP